MKPYYQDESVTLYHGDCRAIVPELDAPADLVIADPPYAETSLAWDSWPTDWPRVIAGAANNMWCFGSMRMMLRHHHQFNDWKLAQEVVWEKHNGSSLASDRFSRVHEYAFQFYRGNWAYTHHDVPTTNDATARVLRKKAKPAQWQGAVGSHVYVSEDGGPRLMRSVIYCRSMHGRALHPTEKPAGILEPLITYACPPGGTILEPFGGSGSAAAVAKATGRRAIVIENNELFCEIAARRLAQDTLFEGAS